MRVESKEDEVLALKKDKERLGKRWGKEGEAAGIRTTQPAFAGGQ